VPQGEVVPIQGVPERLVERCHMELDALQVRGHLSYNYSINSMGFGGPGGGGNAGDLTVEIDQVLFSAIVRVHNEL
jgi:hypothetical protein